MVKKISHVQSRRNAARRRRKVVARQARAGHWGARPAPMLTSGRIGYEIGGNIEATCFGGIAAVHRLVTRLGLPGQLDDRLELLKVHLPYHESDHVLNLAYNVMCGGTRLEDIERLRHDTAYMTALGADLIPDPTTAGDFCRRFAESDVVELMEAINAVRPALWTGRGRDLLGPITYLDVDGTIVGTTGCRKAGMDMSYKGIWGYAPLVVSLANTKEVLYLVNRPGNAPSHAGAAIWIDKAIGLVAPHADRVCLRGDTDFSLTGHFDRWAETVDFVLGMDNNTALRSRAEALVLSTRRRPRALRRTSDVSGRDTGARAVGRAKQRSDLLWHNGRVTDNRKDAEIDVLLGLPGAGFVVVEVKGGQLTHDGQRWRQRSTNGDVHDVDPVQQARDAKYLLRTYVENDPRWGRRGRVRWAHAVVAPFTDIPADFALPDCPRSMIFGRGDLDQLVERLAEIPVAQESSNRRGDSGRHPGAARDPARAWSPADEPARSGRGT